MHTCPQGHEIRSSADRDSQGFCLACRHESNRSYRSRQSAALQLVRALEEEHGIPVTRSSPAVDLRQLAAALANGYQPPDDN